MTTTDSLLLILKAAGQFVPYVNIAETLIEQGFALGHQMQHFAAENGVTLQEWADARDQNKVSLDDEIVKLGGTIAAPTKPDPEPPKTNSKGFPLDQYNTPLAAFPDTKQLEDGDIVYQWPTGSFYVAMHGFSVAGVPGNGWRKVWPEA